MLRKSVYIAFIALFWFSVGSQVKASDPNSVISSPGEKSAVQSRLAEFLRIDHDHYMAHGSSIQQEFDAFIEKLNHRRTKYENQTDFLGYLYYKVHRKYLRHYRTPVSLNDLFEKKSYDCLTGTALYALIFEALGLEYQIVETTYHIYMTLTVEGQPVLIESTNPLQGFVTDPDEIALLTQAFVHEYTQEQTQDHYQFTQPVKEIINLKQLTGLHYYNLALQSYNRKELEPAIALIEQALYRYSSPRVQETMRVMLNTLRGETGIDPFFKDYYLAKYYYLYSGEVAFQEK